MMWVVKKGDDYVEYWNAPPTMTPLRRRAAEFEDANAARKCAIDVGGRVVKIVPKRRRLSEAELSAALGQKEAPRGQMTLTVALRADDAARLAEAMSFEDGIAVLALGWRVGRVVDCSYSWS